MKNILHSMVAILILSYSFLQAQTNTGKSINADFSVSPTGALTYQVPFEVPSYVLGHFPDLGLVFNSQASDGIAGYGWSIAGLSSISRTSATKYHDGFIDPVDFDSNDRFTLDGQRLLLKSGIYGKAGSTYETESFSNLKIEAVESSPFGANYGPKYFIVYHPNGLRYWYGRYYNSHSKLEWSVSKITDTQGNTVNFKYSIINETLRLNSVEDPVAKVKVEFGYDTKSNVNPIGMGGQFFTNNRLLTNVQVKVNNTQPYYDYSLEHENTSDNSKRIKEITQKNRDGEELPKIVFTYLSNYTSSSIVEKKTTSIGRRTGHISLTSVLSGDFNGDEKMDVMIYNKDKEDRNKEGNLKGVNILVGNTNGTFSNYLAGLNRINFDEVFTGRFLSKRNKVSQRTGVIFLNYNEEKKEAKLNVIDPYETFLGSQKQVTWNYPVKELLFYSKREDIFKVSTEIEQAKRDYHIENPNGNTGFFNDTRSIDGANEFKGKNITSNASFSGNKTFWAGQSITLQPGFRAYAGSNFVAKINTERIPMQYISGDFNGDSITDIVAISRDPSTSKMYFLDLSYNHNIPNTHQSGDLQDILNDDGRILSGDYDGDGKSDLFHIANNRLKVYSLDADGIFRYKAHIDNTHFNEDNYIGVGDFNGDGKTDIFNSISDNQDSWQFHFSNGIYFDPPKLKAIGLTYYKNRVASYNYKDYVALDGRSKCIFGPCYNDNGISSTVTHYLPVDFNKDGKTDIIRHRVIAPAIKSGEAYSYQAISFHKNKSTADNLGEFSRVKTFIKNNEGTPRQGHPLYGNLNNTVNNFEYAYLDANSGAITHYESSGEPRLETCIASINNNMLINEFKYAGLVTNDDNAHQDELNTYVYLHQSEYDLKYPFIEIRSLNNFKVVKEITQKFNTFNRKRQFAYADLHSSADGSGRIGFTKMISSGWIADNISTVISESTYDIENYNALRHSTSRDAFYHEFSYTNYEYEYIRKPNKVHLNIPKRTIARNYINNITTTTTNTYDKYYNVIQSTQAYEGGSKTVTNTYFNNPLGTGTNYYIGRPKTKIERTTLGSETFSTSEEYSYTNNFIQRLKTKGNNTPWLTETYAHDTFGNIISKTISAAGITSRTEHSTYDSTGRFMLSATDIEGLTTHYKYNTTLGHLIEEIDPFGKKQKFEYDGWDRLTKQTDYLGNTIETFYVGTSEGGMRISTNNSLGGQSITYLNRLGWEIRLGARNVLNQWVWNETEYDAAGKVTRESQPFFNTASQWTQYYYDEYSRPITQNMYNGLVVSTTYNGLTVTVDDGTKTISTTKDAVGNTVSLTDPGGTINYTYYANNTPKETIYGTHKITNTIDGWGRKIELNDPAAGKYTYKYNILGEILEETTPKGKTIYTLDAYGKPTRKTVKGDQTDLLLSYTYDTTHKQIKQIAGSDLLNNKNYTYSYDYDSNERPTKVTETMPLATITTTTKYDTRGRVETQNYTTTPVGQLNAKNTVTIKNEYHAGSGQLYKILDNSTNNELWSIGALNQRGQLTQVRLGNGHIKTKEYDAYGLPKKFSDKKASGNNIAYETNFSFDAQRGNLLSRNHTSFSTGVESFTYDSQDRLTKIAVNGATAQTQVYKTNGNIQTNPQVGTYQYNPQTQYRVTGIDLNNKGKEHYENHTPQQITYNAYKKPVSIYEKGNGRVDFEYGPLMNRSIAYYGGNTTNKLQRNYIKAYSAIAPIEIIQDKLNNTVKTITYIGGDAYTAPIAHIKEVQGSRITNNQYTYLHRDHLGSIMAITSQAGIVLEQSDYGAWGQVAKYWSANGNTSLGYTSLLGRGYTGHEHFTSVGLIHMNGRMYDAKLRRFLSPDNFIQDPFNTQSFNRYGYVWNNPLKFNDPSGELVFTLSAIIGSAIFKAAVIGAGVGVAVNGVSNLANGQDFFNGAGQAALFGAISGVVSFGIGSAVSNISNLVVKGFTQGFLHGLSGATMAAIQGGDPLAGFASSFVGSAIGSVAGGVFGESTKFWNIAGTIGAAGIGGGIAAELSGGKFADGFRNGVIAAGLNHVAHRLTGPPDKERQAARKMARMDADALKEYILKDGRLSLREANAWYRKGNGQPLTVDASRIDLNGIDLGDWNIGDVRAEQTLFHSRDGRVYGNLTLEYRGNNQFTIRPDVYNFEMHNGNSFGTWVRNKATSIGASVAGKGKSFIINFNGINTVRN